VTAFFVPHATADTREQTYAEMAATCGRPVPPVGRRIFAIEWTHDGEEWTATVGETLRGVKTQRLRRGGVMRDVPTPLNDAATVLAIFAGSPYLVLTNARPLTAIVSHWANPFMAGRPSRVTYFDADAP
jgi:hypothetical protein